MVALAGCGKDAGKPPAFGGPAIQPARVGSASAPPPSSRGNEGRTWAADVLARDFTGLIQDEVTRLGREKTPEPLQGFQLVASADFAAMMRAAPKLDPEAPGFHEGNAQFFQESLGKGALVAMRLASREFQADLKREILSWQASGGVAATKRACENIKRLNTRNKQDLFFREFFTAYLDANYQLGLVTGELEALQKSAQTGVVPTNSELGSKLRSLQRRVGTIVWHPALGPKDVAVRKAVWRMLQRLTTEADGKARN